MGDTIPKSQINLLRGWPHASLLPIKAINEASQRALLNPKVVIPGLCYGPDDGYLPLREGIEWWLGGFYGGEREGGGDGRRMEEARDGKGKKGERICITGGASQNLACVLQVYSDPGVTRVWMVAPCYFLACRIFEDAGLVAKAVPEGTGGIDLEFLERKLVEDEKEKGNVKPLKTLKPWSKIYRHIIYCVPTFSNPSGKTMSLATRQSLINIARKHNALIITDDVYDSLQWFTSPSSTSPSFPKAALQPRLIDLDRSTTPLPDSNSFGNAMSNGSFSKIVGPGVRTGWAEANPKFIYGLSQCGSSRSGGAPSQFTATIVHQLLASGDLENHIETVLKPAYSKRYSILISAISKHLIPLGVKVGETSTLKTTGESVFGGYFIWITLPKNMDAEDVSLRAREEENLILAPGKIFEVATDREVRFPSAMRLCFSWVEEEELEEGVRRLGALVRRLKEEPTGLKGGERGGVDLAMFR